MILTLGINMDVDNQSVRF